MIDRKIFSPFCLACICFAILFLSNIDLAQATTISLGAEYSSNYKSAEALYTPEPEISAELKEQCFKTSCLAKFIIKADSKTSVTLLTSSGSTEVDEIALNTLRSWRFKAATLDGKPVESVRKLQIEFEIE